MVAVIVPSYRVKASILGVIASIGSEVQKIIIVDDACPEETGKFVIQKCTDRRVEVEIHKKNQGVGAAMRTGMLKAIERGAEIIVKLDGDGQMSPSLIPKLIRPIQEGRADYVKGNRFFSPRFWAQMPFFRLVGNSILSFINKASSGYWSVMDPNNGFIAIHAKLIPLLSIEKVDSGFFFESDMLFRLNTMRAVVLDMPMQAVYGNEKSNLKILSILIPFFFKHQIRFFKRILYNYFLRDFNIASVQLVCSIVLIIGGLVFGVWNWYLSSRQGVFATSGTVMLATLPIILGFQLLLSSLNYDIVQEPKTPIHPYL
jgi:glycosyltransferase involved in cell wall biosynthesis